MNDYTAFGADNDAARCVGAGPRSRSRRHRPRSGWCGDHIQVDTIAFRASNNAFGVVDRYLAADV
ncbi:MAG: hypothetical protein WDM84_09000 [Bauldia sp.]